VLVLQRSSILGGGVIVLHRNITLALLVENGRRRRGRRCRMMFSATDSASSRKMLPCYVLVHTTASSARRTAAIAWDGGHSYHILTPPNTYWFLPNADGPAISRADNLKAHQLLSFLHLAVGNISEHSISSPAHHHLSITTTTASHSFTLFCETNPVLLAPEAWCRVNRGRRKTREKAFQSWNKLLLDTESCGSGVILNGISEVDARKSATLASLSHLFSPPSPPSPTTSIPPTLTCPFHLSSPH
jgi:hypothetical protein